MANKNSRTKNSALSLITGMGGQLLNEALRFVTRTVFIYTLGKIFLGINGLFAEIMTMLSLANLGFGTAIIYRLYKPVAENDEKQIRILLKFYKKTYQAIGAVILVMGLCLLPFLKVLIKDYDRLDTIGVNAEWVFLLFLGQSVCSYFFFAYRNCIFSADQKAYIINSVRIVTNIVTCVLQITALYLWQDFILYLVVGITDSILCNLVVAILAYKQYPNIFKVKEPDCLPKEEIKTMFKDCGALLAYKLSNTVNKSSGNLILSAFIGLAVVGVYSNYLMLFVALRTLLSQITSSFKSSLGNLYAVSDIAKKYFFFEVTNLITILVAGTMAVGLICVADELVFVWLGQDYTLPQPFALLLGAEFLMGGLVNNYGQTRTISGLFRQMWFRPIISMLVNLATTLSLINIIGVYALPIGVLGSLMVNFMADPIVIHRVGLKNYRTASSYYWRNAKYLFALASICTINYFICKNTAWGTNWMSVICHSVWVAFSVPATIVFLFHNRKECQYLITKFGHIRIKR